MTAAPKRLSATGRHIGIPRWIIRFGKNRAALVGAAFLGFLLFVAVAADALAPYGANAISRDRLLEPSIAHTLGTDQLGRDVLSRIIYGTRVTLLVGLCAAVLGVSLGTIIGSFAGYFGGWLDTLLMRLVELFQVIPTFFLALIVVAFFGAGIDRIIIVIGLLSWPISARLARAQFLSLKEQNFVEAARSVGFGDLHIIFREILPNASAPLIVQGSLEVASAILIEAGLGFLGLSDPDALTWGSMLQEAKQYLVYAWWVGIAPGAAIFLAVIAFNVLGDGLNDFMNPRLRSRR